MSKVTIKDVARTAGVSIGTVSRYFNPNSGASYVAETTRRRIEKAVKGLKYFPNPLARGMRGKKSYQLGLLTSHSKDIFNSRYHTHLLSGILDGIHESSYRLQIILLKEKEYTDVEEILQEYAIDGLFILTWRIHPNLVQLIENCSKHLPIMLFNDYDPKVQANFVYCDVAQGMEMAAKYLLEKGKKKIAFLKGPTLIRFGKGVETVTVPSIDAHDKFAGFEKAMAEAGLAVRPEWVRECSAYNAEEGYRQARALLQETEEPEAILCSNDEMALGCLKAVQEKKISCPKEMAVMGYDGIEKGEFSTPSLTTVEQLLHSMGEQAARILLEVAEGKLGDPLHVKFAPRIVVRESA